MKQKHRILIIVTIGFVLAASLLVATSPSPKIRRHAMRIQAENRLDSVSFTISTNATARRQSQTP
jgi:hypothetical protein